MNNHVKDNRSHLSIRYCNNVAILMTHCYYEPANTTVSHHSPSLGAKRPSSGDRLEVAVFAG